MIVLLVLIAGLIGMRGTEWSHEPLKVFDDMANQDRVNFMEELPGKLPPGTVPQGNMFTTRGGGYYETGVWEGYYGQGMPVELQIRDKEAAEAFIKRGREQFAVHCAVCHGISGDGKGLAAAYQGFPVLVDFRDEMYAREKYPDGRVFFLITHGLGNMEGYGAYIPVRDRWAIVSWVRVLQSSENKQGEGRSK